MHSRFDAFDYLEFLRGRWRSLGVACATALTLAVAVSLALPKRYTATASVLIDSPAGNDPRASTAVSPIYLESLRTYEHFASSDTLFLRALEHLHIRGQGDPAPVDSMKRSVLTVSKLRDTRILQISATFGDPAVAQALAQYIAEETVGLSRSLTEQLDNEMVADARKQLESARARLDAAEKAASGAAPKEPVEALSDQVSSTVGVKSKIQRDWSDAKADIADLAAQEKSLAESATTPAGELERVRRQLGAVRARADALEAELTRLEHTLSAQAAEFAERRNHRDRLEDETRSARNAYEAANHRYNDTLASSGLRGERLKIVDPGIVPQHPSSPRLILNVIAALAAALVASVLYLTLAYAYRNQRRIQELQAYRTQIER